MKIIITIADIILCGLIVYIIISTENSLIGIIALFTIIILLLLNIYLIYFKSDKSWLNLYFKRKALEEKNKIDKLTKE